jgi:hypothetical protein
MGDMYDQILALFAKLPSVADSCNPDWWIPIEEALAAARREERERCAELADELADINPQEAGNTYEGSYQWGYKECAEQLAVVIRALGEGEEDQSQPPAPPAEEESGNDHNGTQA